MNLRDLHYLVALAEHRHFGRAADACFVSQPTLSTQIKKLEEELGVKLVERTPGKILLTETGREITRRARAVLAEVGGVNLWGPAGHVDLTSALRSPGSAMKPLIYGMAFDDLSLHPATLMQDQATTFGDYAPADFDGEFQGTVSARDGIDIGAAPEGTDVWAVEHGYVSVTPMRVGETEASAIDAIAAWFR